MDVPASDARPWFCPCPCAVGGDLYAGVGRIGVAAAVADEEDKKGVDDWKRREEGAGIRGPDDGKREDDDGYSTDMDSADVNSSLFEP